MKAVYRARAVARLALTKKAHDVVILNLRGLSSVTDYFVICSVDSDVQSRAVGDAVRAGMEEKGESVWKVEAGSSNWIILDFVDVVLHVFHKNARSYYNLEKLWGDAPVTSIEDKAPVAPRARTKTATRKKKAAPRRRSAS